MITQIFHYLVINIFIILIDRFLSYEEDLLVVPHYVHSYTQLHQKMWRPTKGRSEMRDLTLATKR